jgi:hypothetical protein
MPNYYVLTEETRPIGDYGRILVHGMGMHLSRRDGLMQLERTGPFVPPLSLPDMCGFVATAAFRADLEQSGLDLRNVHWQQVIKARIVALDWTGWDFTADDLPEYPVDGEPEGYILDRPHDPRAADATGTLWEAVIGPAARVQRPADEFDFETPIRLLAATWSGGDIFGGETVGYTYVTEQARAWLRSRVEPWVGFEPALTA